MVSDTKGNPIRELLDEIARRSDAPLSEALPGADWMHANIPWESHPAFVQEYTITKPPEIHRISAWSFGKVGKVIDDHFRSTIYGHEFALASKQSRQWFEAMSERYGEEAAYDMWGKESERLAMKALGGRFHDPDVRSYWARLHTTSFPFWFAQQQFITRWGKTIFDNPGTLERLNLMHHASKAVGWVHTDERGNEVFNYPMTGWMGKALSPVANVLFGGALSGSMTVPFTADIKSLSAGTMEPERGLFPSLGPIVSTPLHALAQRFPEAKKFEQAV